MTDVSVSYYAADNLRTDKLDFKVVYDASFFTMDEGTSFAKPNDKCVIDDTQKSPGYFAYACMSLRKQLVVPAMVSELVKVSLKATGKQGSTTINIVPNNGQTAAGYTYKTGAPVKLSMGMCTHAPTPLPTSAPTPAPTAAPTNHPTPVATIPSVPIKTGSGLVVRDGSKTQVLSAVAHTKTCLQAGDLTELEVDYYSANHQPTFALSFVVEFDAKFFTVTERSAAPNALCQLDGFVVESGYAAYTCANLGGVKIVPASVPRIIKLTLKATGATGTTQIKVQPNNNVRGAGYMYRASTPLEFHSGVCDAELSSPPTPTPTPVAARVLPDHGFDLGSARSIGSDASTGERYALFNSTWSASLANVTAAQLRSKLCSVTQADILNKCGKLTCEKPAECNSFSCPFPSAKGCSFMQQLPANPFGDGRRLGGSYSPVDGFGNAATNVPLTQGGDFGPAAGGSIGVPALDTTDDRFGLSAVAKEYLSMFGDVVGASTTQMPTGLPGNFGLGNTASAANRTFGVADNFGMEGSDYALGAPSVLHAMSDFGAAASTAPSAMVYSNNVDTNGEPNIEYLTKNGDLYENIMTSVPAWASAPQDQCIVSQAMVKEQCGVEQCGLPSSCSSVHCPVLPQHCRWHKPTAACDCPAATPCVHASLHDNSCYPLVDGHHGTKVCPIGSTLCVTPGVGAAGVVSGFGLSGLTQAGSAGADGRTFLSHGGRLSLGSATDGDLAVCTVTEKRIQQECGVQQCQVVLPHREQEGGSFVMGATVCGFVSMQDCPRKTIAKNSVVCPTNRCEDTCWLSAWSSWGTCSRSCSGGKQTRTRSVVKKKKNGVCDSLVEERSCNEYRCAGDCVVSTWSTWGACSHNCGPLGRRTRTRTAVMPANVVEGLACPHKEETEPCNSLPCLDAGWHKAYVKHDDGSEVAHGSYKVCSHTKCEVKCADSSCRTYVYDWHNKEKEGSRHHCISKKAEAECVCVCSDQFVRSKVVHIVKYDGDVQEHVSQWDVSGANYNDNDPTDKLVHTVTEKLANSV
jgi:hypothetical protein